MKTQTPLALIDHGQYLMSGVRSSDQISDNKNLPSESKSTFLSSHNSSPQDVTVSLNDPQTEARERLELDQVSEPSEAVAPNEDEYLYLYFYSLLSAELCSTTVPTIGCVFYV